MIELRNISTGYCVRKLLQGVNTSIDNGCLTALIGRNGTGKSTLLRAIAGLNRQYTGAILVNGTDISQMKRSELSRSVSLVTTSRVRIADMTCRDIVALGRAPYTDWIGRLRPDDREIVDNALDKVGMASYGDRSLDTMSDGECQRIMIARAIAQDTQVMLLDEPTSFLDMPARYDLAGTLRELAASTGKCIVMSTHELDIAMRFCDRVILLDPPELHNMTPVEMTQSGVIEQVFGIKKW